MTAQAGQSLAGFAPGPAPDRFHLEGRPMRLADMDCAVRMAFREQIEATGTEIATYSGEHFQCYLPNPRWPAIEALQSQGFAVTIPLYCFDPIGSERPPEAIRHDGNYPGSRGFYLMAEVTPPA